MDRKGDILSGGFADPVFESQGVFRKLMDGMAQPGTIHHAESRVKPPVPLGKAAGAVLLTLCDHDTPFWMNGELAKSGVPGWLAFHSGAELESDKGLARFAVFEAGAALASLGLFSVGTQEYPDRSTTVLIEVAALEGGAPLRLTGPGIQTERHIAPEGLPQVFLHMWVENRLAFPRGIDVILTSGDQFLCLPRSTRIDLMEN
ncbi:phosphonate C-P lyase system protein PhnH [Agrobacterium sp.]|uniref:phosphonate C-P lyase system protein PhnH n=1 Tax=Agrobacterium sp. TaxID=361 RepID=UPI0028B025E4|nr:phosphonate C-P lyase system protein PhnH [Agrobacterium sp.]